MCWFQKGTAKAGCGEPAAITALPGFATCVSQRRICRPDRGFCAKDLPRSLRRICAIKAFEQESSWKSHDRANCGKQSPEVLRAKTALRMTVFKMRTRYR